MALAFVVIASVMQAGVLLLATSKSARIFVPDMEIVS
jgi:hypothetical protein